MGSSSSKVGVQTYAYADIASTALFNVASTCKYSANSNQNVDISGSTISGVRIILSAKQRLECLSTISSDNTFDTKFDNEIDNLVKQHTSSAIASTKTVSEIKTEIKTQMSQILESRSSSELFGSSTQNQLVDIKNSVITNSNIILQADAFIKTVSTVLSNAGMKGEVKVTYATESDNTNTNVVSDLGNNLKDVINNTTDKTAETIGGAVDVVGDTAGGIVDTAKTAITGVLDIVGSPMFLIIIAVIIIVVLYLYMKSPTNPVGAMNMMNTMGPGAMHPAMMGLNMASQMMHQPQYGYQQPQQYSYPSSSYSQDDHDYPSAPPRRR